MNINELLKWGVYFAFTIHPVTTHSNGRHLSLTWGSRGEGEGGGGGGGWNGADSNGKKSWSEKLVCKYWLWEIKSFGDFVSGEEKRAWYGYVMHNTGSGTLAKMQYFRIAQLSFVSARKIYVKDH